MLRMNLATRPFYNERPVHFVLLAAAVLVFVATVFNVLRVVEYSRSDTRLATEANRDESRARELRASAVRLRASVDPKQIEVASIEAREANELIDRRTFSWTELFNRFEKTLPDDVHITAMRPKVDPRRGNLLTIIIVARTVEDVSDFMDKLEATGAFANLRPIEEHFDEQGLLEASLETNYAPSAAVPEARGTER